MNEERRLVVGFVRSPHGITGEFKVESASGRYEHIEALKEVTLRNGSAEKRFSVLSSRSGNGTLYMKLADIDSPEDGTGKLWCRKDMPTNPERMNGISKT